MDYVNWMWKPHGCAMEKFDPHLFLTIVRGKTLAFAGDSIARNQMESLLCLLSQVNTLCFSSSKCVIKGRLAFNLRKPISPVTQLQ